jgi:hypothetical protein
MGNLRSRFSVFSIRNWRKTKSELWLQSASYVIKDMKHVLEEAKDPENLHKWPNDGGYEDVKRSFQWALKYIELIAMDGTFPESLRDLAYVELDLGLDAREIQNVELIDGMEVTESECSGCKKAGVGGISNYSEGDTTCSLCQG